MDDTCREILSQLRTYIDGECHSDFEQVIVEHLGDCPPCLDRADFERELQGIIAHKCKDAAPPDLLQRVIARLQG